MTEADLMYSRRRFLLTSVKAAATVTAGLIVGPQVFEMLDQMGPRRLLVPGYGHLSLLDMDMSRTLRRVYETFREQAFFISTPLFAQIEKGDIGKTNLFHWPIDAS